MTTRRSIECLSRGRSGAAKSAVVAAWLLLGAAPLSAQVVNGSFEDSPNHLNGWTLGPGARVEVLQTGNFAPNTIPVPDGSWYALLSNGPGDVPTAPGGDFDANGTNDFDSATLSTTFTTVAANEALSFEWAFLTDEIGPGAQGDALYDDLFDVTINGYSVLNASVNKPGGSSPLPDTDPYDGLRYTVNSTGLTDGSDFGTALGGGGVAFQNFCLTIANPGTYSLEFRVADQGDSTFDSGLIIDAVQIPSACDPRIQATDSIGASLEIKGGGIVFTPVANGRPGTSRDGSVLAFRSNGDYNGDNPNLQEQIWVATRNGAAYVISRITAAVGARFGDPDVSSGAQWLAFASTADLVPPANADGNSEIFRYDRSSGAFTQVTDTTGCANDTPAINDDGSRITFVSDCDLGFSTTSSEIVLWDGGFRGVDTSGCVSRNPRISRDASGRYVTLVTDCAGQYPGTGNADGSLEILQWDTLTDIYTEVTDTPGGQYNDGPGSSADGRYVSFVSTADHEAGQNPIGASVIFLADVLGGSFLQLTDADPLALYTLTSIDETGGFVAVERLDLITSAFELFLIDVNQPRTLLPVAAGAPTATNNSPVVAVSGGIPAVAFQSDGNFSGNNADTNAEIWVGGAAFNPPGVSVYCKTPDLAIPDRGSVSDTMTVADAGTIADLDFFVRIEHTYVGDLQVNLRHTSTGTQSRVIQRPGRPPGFGCSGDDIEATLDDEAAQPAEDECVTPGPVAIQGSFTPNQPLSRFDGLELASDWQIVVFDRSRRGTGRLLEWCLIPSTQ